MVPNSESGDFPDKKFLPSAFPISCSFPSVKSVKSVVQFVSRPAGRAVPFALFRGYPVFSGFAD
jgi:hypothetical protein